MIIDKLRPYLPPPTLGRGDVVRNESGLLVGGLKENAAWGIFKGKDPHSSRFDVMHQGELEVSLNGSDPAVAGNKVLVDKHGKIYGNPLNLTELTGRVELLEEGMGEVANGLGYLEGEIHKQAWVTNSSLEALGENQKDIVTSLTADMDTKVGTLAFDTGAMLGSLDERITTIESRPPSEGGSHTCEVTQEEFDALEAKVDALDPSAPPVENLTPAEKWEKAIPTKWYVLPLGGQSNMVGFGEIPPKVVAPNPRLAQLGMHTSLPEITDGPELEGFYNVQYRKNRFNVPKECTVYGDLYEEYRPYDDCNLKIIPSSYCLDNPHNLMSMCYYHGLNGTDANRKRPGGLVGQGHYLAQLILPFIPEDYGILIVDCSRGSTGFGSTTMGTYDADTMIASGNARKWSKEAPFGKMFYDRVTHALNTNKEENILLPIMWAQGCSSVGMEAHDTECREYIKWFRDSLKADGHEVNYQSRSIHDFRWLCFGELGRVGWGFDMDNQYYLKDFTTADVDALSWRAMYDGYAHMSNDVEFINPHSGESQVQHYSWHLAPNGQFYESVQEELEALDPPWLSVASSQPDYHFSSAIYMYNLSSVMLTALLLMVVTMNTLLSWIVALILMQV